MSEASSTKPYMVRAIHEWCVDNGMTPYLAVRVSSETRVPPGYVKDGEIVLNLNYAATRELLIGNDAITFSARFGGVSTNLYIPISAVKGIFARETGQGLFFELDPESEVDSGAQNEDEDGPDPDSPSPKKPALRIVK